MRHFTALLVFMLAVEYHVGTAIAAPAALLRCELGDGQVRWMATNLAQAFPLAANCVPVPLSPADDRPASAPSTSEPPTPLTGMREGSYVDVGAATDVTLIEAGPALVRQVPGAVALLPPPPASIAGWLTVAGRRHGLQPAVLAAVMFVESGYRASARSPKGALGLMQIMPATARRYGVQSDVALLDPKTNIETGARYLRDLLARFDGRLDLTLAAYNAGEGSVIACGYCIPPIAETHRYVQRVMQLLASFP